MIQTAAEEATISVWGARVHNLDNIDVSFPRNRLVVLTGLSGSGKSSLAFDTLYAEGQRRYMETLSAYARQFLGSMERPEVDKVEGLSPVIAIEQKTTSRNPRSTVGTVTEIYDFLRLLFARAGTAYSYVTGEPMVQYSEERIVELLHSDFDGRRVALLAPLVRSRKGHYRELFEQIARSGFVKVRVDGALTEITRGMKLDRYKTHDIEVVVDRLSVRSEETERLKQSLNRALSLGKGTAMVLAEGDDKPRYYSRHLMCPSSGISYPEPEPNSFSFNSPKGACAHCNGLGEIAEVDLAKVVPDNRLSIRKGGLAPLGEFSKSWIFGQIEIIGQRFGFDLNTPIVDIPEEGMDALFYGVQESFEVENKTLGVTRKLNVQFEGIVQFIENQSKEGKSAGILRWADAFMNKVRCPHCEGSRLKIESRHFVIYGHNIAQLSALSIDALGRWIDDARNHLNGNQAVVGSEILKELSARVGFLLKVGLDYLSLDRPAKGLSGGEAQRIRLATQIGSQLVNVLYILDEPSIGLHQRDNHKLIESLEQLRDIGNSVLVVEHDRDMMERADHIVDMGPGAGRHGGKIVAQGTFAELCTAPTLTADYLSGRKSIPLPDRRRSPGKDWLRLKGARGNNLKNVDLEIPLGLLVGVSGVSGSGKSTLVNETLYPILNRHFYKAVKKPLPYDRIEGLELLDKVIDIDQSPIGRTPRSNPATYTGVLNEIRDLFAQLPESKVRGYKAGRFSFNVKGGRCETCQGGGLRSIEMNFLPDVYVQCETCQGRRFNRETLEVRYKGKSIADVLDLSVEDAVRFFEHIPKIYQKIKTLNEVGLGYLTLGQSSTTLSGGEAQRVKLAAELSKRDTGRTMYILDEPTTGLHFEDVRMLMEVIGKLVERGNSVLIIEHNLDVLKLADYLIDLGPEGGQGGGRIVGTGTPEQLARIPESHTGRYLALELTRSFETTPVGTLRS